MFGSNMDDPEEIVMHIAYIVRANFELSTSYVILCKLYVPFKFVNGLLFVLATLAKGV